MRMNFWCYVGMLLVVGLGLIGVVSGCKTTTLPDGTVIEEFDLDTAMAIYLVYVSERDRLAAEDAREDAADEAARQARLAELERQLGPVRDWLLVQGAHFLQDEEGRWVSVRSGKVVEFEKGAVAWE